MNMAKRMKSTQADSPAMRTDSANDYAAKDYAAKDHSTMSKSAAVEPAPTVSNESTDGPAQERIAARAYELYLQRGGEPGRDTDDWLEAERELQESSQQSGRQSSGE